MPLAALEHGGELAVADDALLGQDLDLRLVGILQQVADRVGGLPIDDRRSLRDDLGARAPPPRDEPGVADAAQRLPDGRPADPVERAQLHLRRQQLADRIAAGRDPRDELVGDLLIARLIGGPAGRPPQPLSASFPRARLRPGVRGGGGHGAATR